MMLHSCYLLAITLDEYSITHLVRAFEFPNEHPRVRCVETQSFAEKGSKVFDGLLVIHSFHFV